MITGAIDKISNIQHQMYLARLEQLQFLQSSMRSKKTMNMKLARKDYEKGDQSDKQMEVTGKMSRSKRIKERNVIYPLSSGNKIVFITNQYGNGFRKQKLQQFDCPAHIHVEQMFQQVNSVCYNQWKIHHQKLSSVPFEKLELILGIIFATIFLLAIIYFAFIVKLILDGFEILNMFIVVLIILIFGLAVYVCFSRRDPDEVLDHYIVDAVQEKLAEFNRTEQELYGAQARFRWTCHKDCLWIALNF